MITEDDRKQDSEKPAEIATDGAKVAEESSLNLGNLKIIRQQETQRIVPTEFASNDNLQPTENSSTLEDSATKPFANTKATQQEIENLKGVATPQQIEALKEQINQMTEDPEKAILDAVKNNRIVGLGELHRTPNGLRTLVETMAKKLKEAGITHLAVEVNQKHQALLDRVCKGDKQAMQEWQQKFAEGELHARVDLPNWVAMVQAATEAGIKVVAVDEPSDEPNTSPRYLRDRTIADRIEKIVESDKNAKVLVVFGAHHLATNSADKYNSAAELIKAAGKENGYTMETFGSFLGETSENHYFIDTLADTLSRAVSLKRNKMSVLNQDPFWIRHSDSEAPEEHRNHDNLLLMRMDTALKLTEQKYGNNNEKLISVFEDLADAQFRGSQNIAGLANLERALKLEEKLFGISSPAVGVRQSLISVHLSGAQATERLEKGFAILEQIANGKLSDNLKYVYETLVESKRAVNPQEAEKYINRAQQYCNSKGINDQQAKQWLDSLRDMLKNDDKKDTDAAA